MKYAFTGAAVLMISAAPVMAGGIDRSGQFLGPLFEPGDYAEFSWSLAKPTISSDTLNLGAGPSNTDDIAGTYNSIGLAYKKQFNENFSGAVMFGQPFGSDISYPGAADGGSIYLQGTSADIDSEEVVGVVRYKFPDSGFGVHGGLRALSTSATASLGGGIWAAQGLDGYQLDIDRETDLGWLVGVSWEKPEIAARVALTYNSSITHDFDTTQSIPGLPTFAQDITEVKIPKSVNLEFQTGVSPTMLVLGSIRWVDWSEFKVRPSVLGGASLTNFEDSTTYTLGVAKKFTDQWSGAVSFQYEGGGDGTGTPLSPFEGRKGVTLAAIYTQDNLKITTGISYVKLSQSNVGVGEGASRLTIGETDERKGWGVGVKVGYSF